MLELNTIHHGDCLDIMKLIPDKSIDLVLTDPPYFINYKTNHRQDKGHDFCTAIFGDTKKDILPNFISEAFRIMKNDTAMYMFCSFDHVDFFKIELEKFFTIKNMIIWVKNNWTAGDLEAQFGKQYEIIFLANKGRKKFNGKRISDIWDYRRIVGKTQNHQNEKPLRLFEDAIEKHSNNGDTVFDGFAGSGTTGIACLNTSRNFILIEKDEHYYNMAKKRIESHQIQLNLFDLQPN